MGEAESDAKGIIYIDAPLPATVLAEAYRMNDEWDRRQAESDAIDYRAQYEASMRRRARLEEILDVVLGEDDIDGAGEGLVSDVLLALAVAWEQGVVAAHRSDLTLFAIKQVNPYREPAFRPAPEGR